MNQVRFFRISAAFLVLASISLPASALGPSKEMIELETKVQLLLDAVSKLQQSNDERMGVLKDLVQQNSDSVNRMSVTVDNLQKQITAQQTTQGGKIDTVSGQIQSLNDSLDELKARMNRLEKTLNDVSTQQQSIIPVIQNLPQASGSTQPVQAALSAPGSRNPCTATHLRCLSHSRATATPRTQGCGRRRTAG